MRHHYWEWPIATYLFLGGLGGGIFCLAAVFSFFIAPMVSVSDNYLPYVTFLIEQSFALPCLIAIVALAFGCFLLVFELGQPLVFPRVFLKSTSIICWGARILSVCLICGVLWFCSFVPWEWFSAIANLLAPAREVLLGIAGITGFCILLYTGILLSSLKAHSFWATPALPVLFTVSALSTACAAISLAVGGWPAPYTLNTIIAAEVVHEIIHLIDVVLVAAELVVLLVMVLSFLGAGNTTAHAVATRWVKGRTAGFFWIGMIGIGLVLPEFLYVAAGGIASSVVAPVLVLVGGLLLRFLVVFSDERREIPGEDAYYTKLPKEDAAFITKWTYGKNIY